MKILTIISVIVLMSSNSCGEPEPFDAANGKRSFVSGRLLDQQGEGIVDYDVEIISNFDRIGITTTDAEGYYEASVIEPQGGIKNLKVQPLDFDTDLTSFNLSYNYESPRNSKYYAVEDMTLKKKAGVTYEINNNSGLSFGTQIILQNPWCSYKYQEDVLSYSSCFQLRSEIGNATSNRTIDVPLGSVFTIQIIRNSITTEYDFTIDRDNYEILLNI